MRKLIVILGILVLFLAVDVSVLWVVRPEAFSSQAAFRQVGAEALAQVLARVMELRLKLPQQVDDTTTLTAIRAESSRVIYSLSIAASGEAFNRVAGEIADHMNKTGCARADYRKMLSYGLTIVISLHSQDGIAAAPIMFTPQMCGLDK